jgi:hypothetical protein
MRFYNKKQPMKNKSVVINSVCAIAIALCSPLSVSAKEKKVTASPAPSAAPSESKAAASARALPFHGMISAVDQSAKSFTIKGKEASRVFNVTEKSTVTKDGNPATISDIAPNEEVRGSYWKNADGSLEAKTVKLGAKTEKEKSKKKSKKEETASAAPTP